MAGSNAEVTALMPRHRPKSPSLRRRDEEPRPVAFHEYEDIETLLATAVVGNHRYNRVIMTYRQCSKGMRDAVDRAVEDWCADFVRLQNQYTALRGKREDTDNGEEVYKVTVDMERRVKRAFGSINGVMRSFMFLSRVDRYTYYGAVLRRCVLCGNHLVTSSQNDDAENPRHVPCYTLSHEHCQRKHLVIISSGPNPIPKGAEPRDLHRELSAVASFHPNVSDISRASVLPRMSPWFRSTVETSARLATPILVWLRPHPRVNDEDTLYGALGLSTSDVKLAVRKADEHSQMLREQSAQRRTLVAKKTQELTEVYEAEIRVWLGKGKTQWRSIEELEGVHEDMLRSSHIDRLIDPAMKRKHGERSVPAICNSVLLFSKTLASMAKPITPPMTDWMVRTATINSIFGVAGHELQYVDREVVDTAVENESIAYAKALDIVEAMNGNTIECIRVKATSPGFYKSDLSYEVHVRMTCPSHTMTNSFAMSHVELCKLKFVVAAEMSDSVSSKLPLVPSRHLEMRSDTEAAVLNYVQKLISVCMSREAGMARSIVLSHILSLKTFMELVSSCRYSAAGSSTGAAYRYFTRISDYTEDLDRESDGSREEEEDD